MSKYFIGFYLFLFMFFLSIFDVFAANDSGYDSSTYNTYYSNCNVNVSGLCNTRFTYDSFTTSGFKSLGTHNGLSYTGYPTSYIGRWQIRVFGGSDYTYKAGNTYTMRFSFEFDASYGRLDIVQKYYDIPGVLGNTTSSYSNSSTGYIDSFSYRWSQGSTDQRIVLYLTFKPNTDIKYVGFFVTHKDMLPWTDTSNTVFSETMLDGGFNYFYLKVTYEEGVNAVIENQTIIIQQGFDQLIENVTSATTNIEDIYLNETENEDGTCGGVICNLKKVVRGIIDFPKTLLNAFTDGLTAVFLPTSDQLYEIIEDARELSENFGFVGESFNFFIDLLTSLLGMANSDGCIEMPAFSLGKTSLTPNIHFWDAQQYCLADNEILSENITTIRFITSVALICMFLNFSASKFDKILSKNDDDFEKGRDSK